MREKAASLDYNQRARQYVTPPKRLKISEWADQNRVLSSETSAEPGQWRTDRAPYQREIMDAITQPGIEKVVVMSCGQAGKTEIILNTIGYYIDVDPCPILMIQPTEATAEDYSKRRVSSLIRDTKVLADKVSDSKSRDINNTILMKVFPGGFLSMGGANSPAGLASRPIRILLCDEVDRYPDSAGTEGDPIQLAEKRTITFWNRKKIYVSTPGIKGVSRIEFEYESGTQEERHRWCPHCGDHVFINLYGMIYNAHQDPKGNWLVENVVFRCPYCLEEADEINWKAQEGQWFAQNPDVKGVRSFRLNSFVSPWTSWTEIITEYLRVKDDPEQYKVFVNTVLGEPYEVKGEIENEEYLVKRREQYAAELPDGVLLLTAAVDVQDRWLEFEVCGWGKGEESWGIKHGVIMGAPDKPETWQTIDDILKATYRFADGLGLTVACACIDSGGHYTSRVYDYCKLNEGRRIFAIKGQGGSGIPLIHHITRTKKENAALIILGVDEGKTAVINSLKVQTPGPFYCHFPLGTDYDVNYFQGLISERLVQRKYRGRITMNWEKVSAEARNEPFDIRNYARAAMKLIVPVSDKGFLALEKRLQAARSGSIIISTPTKQKPSRVIRSNLDGGI
jgi:phage terminase large subunit GpA-like protein